MALKRDTILPLLATSVAVVATVHVVRPSLQKLWTRLALRRTLLAQHQAQSDDPKSEAKVNQLNIHPVKSLRAVNVQEAELDSKGFVDDRRLMLVFPVPLPPHKEQWEKGDTTHRFMTQRQCPSLARVEAKLSEGGDVDQKTLSLKYGNDSLQISLKAPGDGKKKKMYRAGIWDDNVMVEDLGDEAAAFFQSIVTKDEDSAAAGGRYQGVRLVIHNSCDRRTDPQFTPAAAMSWIGSLSPQVSLTDGFPILIACEESLDELNRRLEANGKSRIEMSRFRPNIVIQGTKAFEEDRWKYIAIGDQIFAIVKACPRCKQSCTDQETGKVHSEPVETMKQFRALNVDNKEDVFFAQNALPLGNCGKIRVGDTVRVLERGEPVYC